MDNSLSDIIRSDEDDIIQEQETTTEYEEIETVDEPDDDEMELEEGKEWPFMHHFRKMAWYAIIVNNQLPSKIQIDAMMVLRIAKIRR